MFPTNIPAPDPHELLLPLLACLPTAYASPRPPPALLPLLTPILRQRLQLLSGSGNDSWLPLLTWDRVTGTQLPGVVENIQLEPHPVSGEIELDNIGDISFRRLDHETLQARFPLEQYNLLPIYLWCMGEVNAWKLAELRTIETQFDGTKWYETLEEANQRVEPPQRAQQPQDSISGVVNGTNGEVSSSASASTEEEDDSDYWAAYDQTPSETPVKRSPAPAPAISSGAQGPSASELEYFARYMTEVQPALDPDDPSEEQVHPLGSTLHGNALNMTARDRSRTITAPTQESSSALSDARTAGAPTAPVQIQQPRPSSSSSNDSVQRLERQVSRQVQAEIGIKQHISTGIKSLYRLATSAGIDRAEFERIVKTELEMLTLLEIDR